MNCDESFLKNKKSCNSLINLNISVNELMSNSVCKKKKRPINFNLTNESFKFNNPNSTLHSSPENSYVFIGKKFINSEGNPIDKLNSIPSFKGSCFINESPKFIKQISFDNHISINDYSHNNPINNYNNNGLIIYKSNKPLNISNIQFIEQSQNNKMNFDRNLYIKNQNNSYNQFNRNSDLKNKLMLELGTYNKEVRNLENNCYFKCCNEDYKSNC